MYYLRYFRIFLPGQALSNRQERKPEGGHPPHRGRGRAPSGQRVLVGVRRGPPQEGGRRLHHRRRHQLRAQGGRRLHRAHGQYCTNHHCAKYKEYEIQISPLTVTLFTVTPRLQ